MKRVIRLAFFSLCFHLALFNITQAVPPLPGHPKPDHPTCHVNIQAAQERLAHQAKFAPAAAPPIASTTYTVAVIRVDFSDKTMEKTLIETQAQFVNFKTFFQENSYQLLTVSATISQGGAGSQGAYRMPKTHSTYANGTCSDYPGLVLDAIGVATTAGFNFSSYNHVMVYHAGPGAESSTGVDCATNDNIWSVYFSQLAGGPIASGKTFPGVTFVPEKEAGTVEPFGVMCHEYGHQIGLPDLYNTSDGSAVVGKWSLMDTGVYIGSPLGSNPAHLDAWCKQYLGFSSPQKISFTAELSTTLAPAETARQGAMRIPIEISDVGSDNEYFLIEYRKTTGASYDNSLPAQGLLVWHIDDSIASNSTRLNSNNINNDSARRGIDLIEADSSDPSTNQGDNGDPFPGSTNHTLFNAPKSNAYNGKDSGNEIADIANSGSSAMSFTLRTPYNNPAIAKNTNAGGVVVTGGAGGYTNPALGESSLLGIRPKSSETVEINIYTLSGDLVWETQTSGSANVQHVVKWAGKNSDGKTVSSGIYVAHIKGAGIDLKKKIAIVK